MCKDLLFDQVFYYLIYVLLMIDECILVVNDLVVLCDVNEKFFVLCFFNCCLDSFVLLDQDELFIFCEIFGGDMIVKLFDGVGGEGIFYIIVNDCNVKVIFEVLIDYGICLMLVQCYIFEICQGDKCIILIEGELVGVVLCVLFVIEVCVNFYVGGIVQKMELIDCECEICVEVGLVVCEMGIVFVGIDVIGDWFIEVNVISLIGICEIVEFDGVNFEVQVVDVVVQCFVQ